MNWQLDVYRTCIGRVLIYNRTCIDLQPDVNRPRRVADVNRFLERELDVNRNNATPTTLVGEFLTVAISY